MSLFKQQRLDYLNGTLSFESAEHVVVPVSDSAITVQDVMEVKEEREQLAEVSANIAETSVDVDHLAMAAPAVGIVATAVSMAPTVSPISSDAFVELANESFEHAGRTLGEKIPRLRVADNGKIDEESMEGLGSWFTAGAKAFMGATNKFLERIKLNFVQLRVGSKGLTTRIARVTAKMNSRKGTGGKPLKLSASTRFRRVTGNGYSGQLIADAEEFWATLQPFIAILTEYDQRLTEFTKKRIAESISSGTNVNFLSQLNTADLVKRLEALVNQQPVLLGNQRLSIDPDFRGSSILSYALANAGPDANVLVKHLDAPTSLSNEEIAIVLQGLTSIVGNQLIALERTIDQVDESYMNVEAVLGRLNNNYHAETDVNGNVYEAYSDLGDGVNSAELLRLEYQLVGELGRCGERLQEYYVEVANQLDAILVLVEESIFQD